MLGVKLGTSVSILHSPPLLQVTLDSRNKFRSYRLHLRSGGHCQATRALLLHKALLTSPEITIKRAHLVKRSCFGNSAKPSKPQSSSSLSFYKTSFQMLNSGLRRWVPSISLQIFFHAFDLDIFCLVFELPDLVC